MGRLTKLSAIALQEAWVRNGVFSQVRPTLVWPCASEFIPSLRLLQEDT